jgi:hypothetical protein
VNSYRLYVLHSQGQTPLLTHLQFCTKLYCKLLQYSTAVQQIQLQMAVGITAAWPH